MPSTTRGQFGRTLGRFHRKPEALAVGFDLLNRAGAQRVRRHQCCRCPIDDRAGREFGDCRGFPRTGRAEQDQGPVGVVVRGREFEHQVERTGEGLYCVIRRQGGRGVEQPVGEGLRGAVPFERVAYLIDRIRFRDGLREVEVQIRRFDRGGYAYAVAAVVRGGHDDCVLAELVADELHGFGHVRSLECF